MSDHDPHKEAGEPAFAWEEPTARVIGGPLRKKLAPLIERLAEKPGDWALLLLYTSETGGSSAAQRARKIWPDIVFKSVRTDDGSALYGAQPIYVDDDEDGPE